MTNEEKEAINKLNNFKTITVLYGNTYAMHIEQLKQLQENINIVLNLVEKLKARYYIFTGMRSGKQLLDRLLKEREMLIKKLEEIETKNAELYNSKNQKETDFSEWHLAEELLSILKGENNGI